MANTSRVSASSIDFDVSEKARNLFKLLVEEYLTEGHPIGSGTLAGKSGIRVSSATVRNIMVDLESKGLVSSPHTSAGKIPTHQGLRFFIDKLISVKPLDQNAEILVWKELNRGLSPQEIVESASHLLSEVSHLAGVVTTPRSDQIELRQVEFLQLSGNRVLAILVVNEREVQNRVIETDRSYSEVELHQAANYVNDHYGGKTLEDVRFELLDSMRTDQTRMNELLQTALDVATKALAPENERSFVVAGERNLVNLLTSTTEVQKLMDAFASKSMIVHLLDGVIQAEGMHLFIGEESGYRPFDDFSLVSSTYEVDGKIAGALGVIGPTRMSYQRLIPLVDVTARLLGEAIEQSHTG